MSKLRIPRQKRVPRVKPRSGTCIVRVPAWLTRCATMGYEVWSDKPERVEAALGGGFKNLVGWEETGEHGSFYFRVPFIDSVTMESPIHLNEGGMRRIWLNIELTCRRMPHAEKAQTIKD